MPMRDGLYYLKREKNHKQTISEVRKTKDFPRESPVLYKEFQRTESIQELETIISSNEAGNYCLDKIIVWSLLYEIRRAKDLLKLK